ncbi:MAG TPA: glycosyltransferase family 1 protein [Terriglobia bacterium]|nr:glycosyltransferase family 1 protein [Terriglobia bacterium]
MNFGIDVRPLSRPPAGIHRAVRNLLEHLQAIDSENRYYLYSDREFELVLRNNRWQKRVHRTFSFLPGSVWLQTDAKRMAVEDGVDVFWGTSSALPLKLPSSMRKMVTVYDLYWIVCPETLSLYNRLAQRALAGKSMRRADMICVPSESTKQQVLRHMGSKVRAVTAVHLGIEENYFFRDPVYSASYIAQKFATSADYLCAVGTMALNKNLSVLFEAIRILHQRCGFKQQLLIAGPNGSRAHATYRCLASLGLTREEVKFLGYVPDEDMPYLYAGASGFVFPSLHEGFGFPVLEAMACGAPVACSNRSSVPEIAGDAAVYFNPESADEMAQAVERLLSDSTLRESLVEKGFARAKMFTWGACARKTLSVLNSLVV